jgi:hypothetical protein
MAKKLIESRQSKAAGFKAFLIHTLKLAPSFRGGVSE